MCLTVLARAGQFAIGLTETLWPNKSDTLSYLDDGAPLPRRFARVNIHFPRYVQEVMVGPLPITEGVSHYTPLTYIYGGDAKMRILGGYGESYYVAYDHKLKIKEILHDIFKGVRSNLCEIKGSLLIFRPSHPRIFICGGWIQLGVRMKKPQSGSGTGETTRAISQIVISSRSGFFSELNEPMEHVVGMR